MSPLQYQVIFSFAAAGLCCGYVSGILIDVFQDSKHNNLAVALKYKLNYNRVG